MILNCIIVDDEPLALDILAEYVRRTPFLNLVARCTSGIEALDILRTKKVDLAFLDIQMPQLNGIELSKLVSDCAIVFTTAFEQYAIEGYKVDAVDYLLKPFSYAEFLAAADKCANRIELFRAKTALEEIEVTGNEPNNIAIKSEYKQIIIDIRAITYIEGIGDYIKIHTDNAKLPIQTLMSLKAMQSILPLKKFVRVHRSFIVNIDKITSIERNRIVFGKEFIPISDSYKEEFDKIFNSIILK